MTSRSVRMLLVTTLLLPMMAVAETPPTTGSDADAKLQQRIKELDVYAKSLEKRVADLAKRNDELERRLDQRWPQFRLVVPPGTPAVPYARPSPRATPPFEGPSTLPPGQPGWTPRDSGNTSHYLVPTEQSIVP